jgi:hypothetical protein
MKGGRSFWTTLAGFGVVGSLVVLWAFDVAAEMNAAWTEAVVGKALLWGSIFVGSVCFLPTLLGMVFIFCIGLLGGLDE